MSDEDDFRLRAKARKSSSRGAEVNIPANYKGFFQEARIALVRGKAVSGRRTLTIPSKPRTGRFNSRGRGRAALERGIGPKQGWRIHKATGDRYRARRAIVKVRVVKLRNAKSSVSRGHLAYLQREGAGVERTEGLEGSAELTPTRGHLYGPEEGVEVDGRDFVARSQESFDGRGDPHQFRIMISPEDGAELARVNGGGTPNLKDTSRALMAQMEQDLGTRLDWVAVDHFDTAHPHTHIIARGVTHDGKGLNIAGEYISRGIRGRLEEEITRDLGWKAEREIKQEIKRDMNAMKITPIDHEVARVIDRSTNIIDLRAGSAASTFPESSSMNRHVLIGRMRHLESVGLAEPVDAGRWRIQKGAYKVIQRVDQRSQLTAELAAAMKRANISRPMRLDDGRESLWEDGNERSKPHRIIGRVISKSLGGDEGMEPDPKGGSKVRFIVDGSDGYVRAIETGLDTRAGEAAKVGSIVEIGPPRLRKTDRNIRDIAQGVDYQGNPNNGQVGVAEIDMSARGGWRDPSARQMAAHMRSHRLRLETLTKAGLVTVTSRSPNGEPLTWQVPEGFDQKAIALDLQQGRASGVIVLSVQDLNTQLASPGATWLDRSQVSWSKGAIASISAPQSVLGKEIDVAFHKRRAWLIERGHAELRNHGQSDPSVSYKRGYVKALEADGFKDAAMQMEGQTNKAFVAAQTGRLIEGTVTKRLELTHGPHAMVETQRAFYLVPWQSVHVQTSGRRIQGRVLSGGGIDWEAGRTRGIGR